MVNGASAPAPMSQAAAVLILTLADADTPIYLGKSHDTSDIRAWITFHTSAPFSTSEKAMFGLGDLRDFSADHQFSDGTAQYPDRSTTLIIEVHDLKLEGAELSGPGIEAVTYLNVPPAVALQREAALYPLGIDVFLTCVNALAALPRTTKVQQCM